MRLRAIALSVLLLTVGACSLQQPTSTASSPRTAAVAALDAEVAMPAGFPADFPVYPHARLTAVADFASGSQMSWGLEWESLDAQARVAAFYTKQLGLGDWVVTGTTSPNGDFAATFARRSSKSAHGTVYVARYATSTRILVSLVYPA